MNADREIRVDGIAPGQVARPGSAAALADELVRAGAAGLKVLPSGAASRMDAGVPLAGADPARDAAARGRAVISENGSGAAGRMAAGITPMPTQGAGPDADISSTVGKPEGARRSGAARLDLLLVTAGLSRVLEYEPADLTVTVEAGCSLRALDSVLGERGQFLPLQGRRCAGTVGGLLATAPEGALALGHGQPRDSLTGVRIALADGSLIKAGGRVVKNVAGFPIHRLMTGSFGTLGVIVEASFKIQPRPEAEGSALIAFATAAQAFDAARRLLDSGLEPVFVNVLMQGGAALLAVGFDGLEARVKPHLRTLADLVAPARPEGIRILEGADRQQLRDALDDPAGWVPAAGARDGSRWPQSTDFAAAHGRDDRDGSMVPGTAAPRPIGRTEDRQQEVGLTGQSPALEGLVRAVVRVSALPSRIEETAAVVLDTVAKTGVSARADARPGLGSLYVTIEERGASGVARALGTPAVARALGAALAAARTTGHAVVISAPAAVRGAVDPWGPPAPDFPLMQRIKKALDPGGLFVGGRFVGGL